MITIINDDNNDDANNWWLCLPDLAWHLPWAFLVEGISDICKHIVIYILNICKHIVNHDQNDNDNNDDICKHIVDHGQNDDNL